ncbi:hypothetical protein ANN_13024 [Periplaneta americana]|uniref:Uncharacterized protein n=1 Tax=Periplaneta americana TaxID=6978 RepID=A0ABQ8TKD4_PERAM|nr:hypothetical protein ANN_13024 [Periplaneta americana]
MLTEDTLTVNSVTKDTMSVVFGFVLCDMYSNQEQAEVHFMYGKADDNAALARRLYQERCPDRLIDQNQRPFRNASPKQDALDHYNI